MFMRMTIAVGRCLKRKIMLVWAKQYINKNFASCKSLCSLQVLYAAFKEKDPNVNIGFWNFSKITQSVPVCSTHQNVVLLVDAMDWDLTYKYPIKKIFYNPEDNKYIVYRCESRPGTATLKDFLNRNSANMKMIRNLITISGTLWIEQYSQPLQPFTKKF